jgi:tRNA A37 threonylcarbamoyladenosine modification protein TsaB
MIQATLYKIMARLYILNFEKQNDLLVWIYISLKYFFDMNVLIDAVSQNGVLFLFNNERQIVDSFKMNIAWNEVQNLGKHIITFLEKNNQKVENLENIVVVHGPGSFTGIRTIVLIVNTYVFVYPHICITPVSYFELFEDFPIIKPSSKRDVFIKKSSNSDIEILSNEELNSFLQAEKIQKISGDMAEWYFWDIALENQPNYAILCKNIVFQEKKRIEPLYIKKPNIM